eukprot:CAMPEP_0183772088 /NCGR_PEP_ID=MMETSP0739-20130205/34922_1 /TAXON_ID=385413 /ORGANISM="Thalassiosira miniscula, Strain CCMP1093" /LENGTH=76 /DNA_ID=CAMNT_0026012687 /DNA_START=10 /DNA_END=236 /DNA_ORIENTATION=+
MAPTSRFSMVVQLAWLYCSYVASTAFPSQPLLQYAEAFSSSAIILSSHAHKTKPYKRCGSSKAAASSNDESTIRST